ncbi:MAG: hypothetical protein KIS92_10970 [Planctomycetota bacterium]|nr:hypothetical protein [Planctomycetota bacterium]
MAAEKVQAPGGSFFHGLWKDPNRLVWNLALAAVTAWLVLTALLSLKWEIYWDQVCFLYQAFLVNEKGYVLYRDIFDVNMPGAAGFMIFFSKFIGYSDLAWRILDLLWLGAILALTWSMLKPFGRRASWAAVLGFAWLYLMQPESQLLQRDYVMLLPIAAACALALSPERLARFPRLKLVLIGALFGFAALIKPQAGIALPFVAWRAEDPPGAAPAEAGAARWKAWALRLLFASAGVLAVFLLAAAWLWSMGSLERFLYIAKNYWPIYSLQIFDESMYTIERGRRWSYIFDSVFHMRNLYGRQWACVPALLVPVLALGNPALTPRQRAAIRLFRDALILYFLEVVLVGHFHPYAWIPMLYFAIVLCGVAMGDLPALAPRFRPRLTAVVAGACLAWAASRIESPALKRQLAGERPVTPWTEPVEQMASTVRPYMLPGDKIQALDWLGGSERVMLDLRLPMATPYLYDAGFYHATHEPLVKALQEDFLERLRREPPRFILVVSTNRMHAFDPRDDGTFKARLEELLTKRYRSLMRWPGYDVLIRSEPAPPSP